MKILIIGGGVAGATTALLCSREGHDVTLVEKQSSLASGPPYCHLHAGGCFYREISDDERKTLLIQSIESARMFPETIMKRPTVLITPQSDPGNPEDQLATYAMVRAEYRRLVDEDPENEILGPPEEYFQAFSREEAKRLRSRWLSRAPQTKADWLVPVVKAIDLDAVKYPIYVTQEPGWNTFVHSAALQKQLAASNVKVHLETTVHEIHPEPSTGRAYGVSASSPHGSLSIECDYLVNAAGHVSGLIDDLASEPPRASQNELKAAYVSLWDHPSGEGVWPEVLFHGPRGSKDGMAQLTPYGDSVFQLHGMVEGITLFEGGLTRSPPKKSTVPTAPPLVPLVEGQWDPSLIEARTKKAILHMSRFLPNFKHARPGPGMPLWGCQQIPGTDPERRAASATVYEQYARIEIVKASSAVSAAREIIAALPSPAGATGSPPPLARCSVEELRPIAGSIAEGRGLYSGLVPARSNYYFRSELTEKA